MRLTDADREVLYTRLSAHAGAGSIDLDELERRVEALAAAETAEQAAELVADLGPLPGEPPPGSPTRPRWGRGHGEADRIGAGWRATNEVFRDPRTQRVMRVWEDSAGARHYVADDAAGAAGTNP